MSKGRVKVEEEKLFLEVTLHKKLKDFTLNINLQLKNTDGQVIVLFGPSGSGKSMTLNSIAGVTSPESGFIAIAGRPVFDSRRNFNLKIQQRRVGYLPQHYGLFPHLTVVENIAFGLFKWDKTQTEVRVTELINMLQLQGLEKQYPRHLSGGQQQRAAFARALAPKPDILLLDEPFSALDTPIRNDLRQRLAVLSRQLKLPVVFITHDLEEAFMLADRIAVYDQGRILQFGSREQIFYHPDSTQVARLIGIRNIWPATVTAVDQGLRRVQVRTSLLTLWAQLLPFQTLPSEGSNLNVCVRPERFHIEPLLASNDIPDSAGFTGQSGRKSAENFPENVFKGRVTGELARGTLYTLFFKLNPDMQPEVGQESPYDLEVEISSERYNILKLIKSNNWLISIPPEAVQITYQD